MGNWAILGHTGIGFWAILGVLGHTGIGLWGTGPYWAILGKGCGALGHTGPYWDWVLGHTGCTGMDWDWLMGHWDELVHTGIGLWGNWAILGHTGRADHRSQSIPVHPSNGVSPPSKRVITLAPLQSAPSPEPPPGVRVECGHCAAPFLVRGPQKRP